jgi:ferredoxin
MKTIGAKSLGTLFDALAGRGYTIVGPTVRDQVIVYDRLESAADLPSGWTDVQDGGTYRLQRRDDGAYFGYVVGPHSWKNYLFPPRRKMWAAKQTNDGFTVEEAAPPAEKFAFVGVRSCELRAIEIQDRVLAGGEYRDDAYEALRRNALIVAVNCTVAGGTCFCVSMDTGPKARGGYDIALTEIVENGAHYFTVETGSDRGREIVDGIEDAVPAKAQQIESTERAVAGAAEQMGRTLDTNGVKELLYDNIDNGRWEKVARRCLTCGNCTMVCPTCFCTTVEDTNDLSGNNTERWRAWDSCFSIEYSYIHGGSMRRTAAAQYRQWLTHKLATWQDQFDTMGCVGCGRCITWCPVGIDITEEVGAIRAAGKE